MQLQPTLIEDLFVVSPQVFNDERGYFLESFNQRTLASHGLKIEFIQDNESFSKFGTLRGLHFQAGEFAQAKLVRVVKGSILDVAVDLRPLSKTFGQYFSIELNSNNKKQLLIPKEFAHGFVVLSEYAIVLYKCSNFYQKTAEDGIRFDDSDLNIDWQVPTKSLIINERDANFQSFKQFKRQYLDEQ